MTLDELKKGLGLTFAKDLSRLDPTKKGIGIGENVRIYEVEGGFEVRFLLGIPPGMRAPTLTRLDQIKATYTVGKDFRG